MTLFFARRRCSSPDDAVLRRTTLFFADDAVLRKLMLFFAGPKLFFAAMTPYLADEH